MKVPKNFPKEWTADCEHVGKSNGASTYLARYRYSGVISMKKYCAATMARTRLVIKTEPLGNIKTSSNQRLWFLTWQSQAFLAAYSTDVKGHIRTASLSE